MRESFLGLCALRNSAKHGQIEKGRGMAERWGVDTVDDAGAALTEEEAEQMWKRSSEFDGPGPLVLRVHQTVGNRSGLTGYRSNRSGPVPVWSGYRSNRSGPVLVWSGMKPVQIQNLNLNSKK